MVVSSEALRVRLRSARSPWNPLSQILRLCPSDPVPGLRPWTRLGDFRCQTPLSWYFPHGIVSQIPLCE